MTKNRKVERVSDIESEGIGVRVLVDGAWGFACDRRLSREGAREAALRAGAFARAAAEAARGSYRTPLEVDPFAVSLADKVGLCLRAEAALEHADVKVRQAFVRAL